MSNSYEKNRTLLLKLFDEGRLYAGDIVDAFLVSVKQPEVEFEVQYGLIEPEWQSYDSVYHTFFRREDPGAGSLYSTPHIVFWDEECDDLRRITDYWNGTSGRDLTTGLDIGINSLGDGCEVTVRKRGERLGVNLKSERLEFIRLTVLAVACVYGFKEPEIMEALL